MPLKCLRNGTPVYAFDIALDEQWEELRQENKLHHTLRMSCCNSDVILRTSKHKLRHFAHAPEAECSSAGETMEHLLAKQRIVEGVRRANWSAHAEHPGSTPSGEGWIADVLATKQSSRAAFEVQWSKQSEEETRQRNDRYRSSGVYDFWLFRQLGFPIEKKIRAFNLTFEPGAALLNVRLPSSSYSQDSIRPGNDKADYWGQTIELSRFVEGVLKNKLKFAPALGKAMPVEILTRPAICWNCKQTTLLVKEIVFAADRLFPGHGNIKLGLHNFLEFLDDGEQVISAMLPKAFLKAHNIGELKQRYNHMDKGRHFSNGCVYCDRVQQRRFQVDEEDFKLTKTLEIKAVFEKEWGEEILEAYSNVNRWWFDDRW